MRMQKKCPRCQASYPAGGSVLECPFCGEEPQTTTTLTQEKADESHKRAKLPNAAAVWCVLALLLGWSFGDYVLHFGGVRRLISIDRGPAVAAQLVLIGASFLLSRMSWLGSEGISSVAVFVSLLALACGLSLFMPGIPAIGLLNPYMFPFWGIVVWGIVFFAAIFTAGIPTSDDQTAIEKHDRIQTKK